MFLAFLMAFAPVQALAQVPAAPVNMRAKADVVTGNITVRWDNPNDNTITAYEYRVRVRGAAGWRPDWTEFTGSDANTVAAVLSNIGEGTTIEFHLRACNASGHGADSFVEATVSGTPSDPDPPDPPDPPPSPPPLLAGSPTNLRADFENSTYDNLVMTMTWAPPFTGADNVTGYEFVIYEGGPTSRVFPPVVDWTAIPEDSVANFKTRHAIAYDPDVLQYTLRISSVVDGKRQGWAQAGVYVPDRIKSVVLSDESYELPGGVVLGQNYPNPFNPSTTIEYAIKEAGPIRLTVYDMLGQEMVVLVDGTAAPGTYQVLFDAGDLPSGAYVYRLETAQEATSDIMSLIK